MREPDITTMRITPPDAVVPVEPWTLDDKGRCCGRKPLVYKRPTFHLFCFRCDRQYGADGQQQENWAYHRLGNGLFVRGRS